MKDLTQPINFGLERIIDKKQYERADWFYKQLTESVIKFQKKLDNDHEVGAAIASFGRERVVYITKFGYWNPNLFIVYGEDEEGNPVELLQHISQINILLVSLKKRTENPRRIGFQDFKNEEEEK